MHYEIRLTAAFEKWSRGLKDPLVLRAIPARIDQMEQGNFGNHRSVGGQVSEVKINIGKGYRLYYTMRKRTVVFLLCGGDKGAQKRDIKTAQVMAQQLKEE